MNEPITIVVAIDNHLKYYASTMLVSLFENNKDQPFHFYIVTEKDYLKDINYLFKIIDKYNSSYSVITLTEEYKNILSKLMVSHHITYFAYIRLLLPELLPDSLKKVLYLDLDLLIVDKLKPLWDTNIENYPLGAVTLDGREDHEELKEGKKLLGIPSSTPYLNSGVLLINLAYFRKTKKMDEMIRFITQHPDCIKYWDQDALNLFLYDSLLELDKRWNMDEHNSNAHRDIPPAIIHYTGVHKPLSGYNAHPYKDEFMKYFRKNPLYTSYLKEKIIARFKSLFAKGN